MIITILIPPQLFHLIYNSFCVLLLYSVFTLIFSSFFSSLLLLFAIQINALTLNNIFFASSFHLPFTMRKCFCHFHSNFKVSNGILLYGKEREKKRLLSVNLFETKRKFIEVSKTTTNRLKVIRFPQSLQFQET